MSEKQHIQLIMLVSFVYVFLGTMPKIPVDMNYVSWYMALYLIASFVRLYPRKIFEDTKFWGWTALVVFCVSLLSVIACAWVGTKTGAQIAFYFVSDSNKILAVATALSAFLFFKNVKIRHSRIINAVAASTFGVLQIHANSDAMRTWLWQNLLRNVDVYDSRWLIVHAFGSVISVFAVCTMIDVVRRRIVEKMIRQQW